MGATRRSGFRGLGGALAEAGLGYFEWSLAAEHVQTNRVAREMLGLDDSAETPLDSVLDRLHDEQGRLPADLFTVVSVNQPLERTVRTPGRPGAKLALRWWNEPHPAPRVCGLLQPLPSRATSSGPTEQEFRQALELKDTRLRELEHRVRNSLQLVCSLLSLQARRASDPVLRARLNQCYARMTCVNLAHEALSRSPDLARIDLCDFLRRLVQDISSIYSGTRDQIKLHCDPTCETFLDSTNAIPCGLIVAELIAYAFERGSLADAGAQVEVGCHCQGDRTVLSVPVANVDPEPNQDPQPEGELGLELAHGLARQLGGELEESRGADGTLFRLTW